MIAASDFWIDWAGSFLLTFSTFEPWKSQQQNFSNLVVLKNDGNFLIKNRTAQIKNLRKGYRMSVVRLAQNPSDTGFGQICP
jgi:hypothetical protein